MNNEPFEYVCCNICGADAPQPLIAAPPTPQFPGRSPGVVRCRACGLVYRNVRRRAAAGLQSPAPKPDTELAPDWIAGRQKAFSGHIKPLESFRRNNRILDVGAGHGFFLSMCAERGWDCYGVEPSRSAADYARRHGISNLFCGAFEDSAYPDGYFDAVTFFNTLDFLPDPRGALQKTHRLLRPGGVVLARFPNAVFHVAAFRLFLFLGRIHPKLNRAEQAVIHLYAFDQNSITRLLRETGFTGIEVSGTPLGWTTASHARIGLFQKLACKLLSACAVFCRMISFNQLLCAPSLAAVARKN